jgi:DNA-binding transcriptional ArsR family regulator
MMGESISEFILRRRGELTGEAEPLRERLRAIDSELRELKVAEDAIKRAPPSLLPPSPLFNSDPSYFMTGRAPRGAIKKAIVRTLAGHPDGLDAMSILSDINRRDGTDYERTSLSPQLSRLKADGIVTLNGNIWSLIRNPLLGAIPVPMAELDDDEPPENESEISDPVEPTGNPGAGGAGAL